jgi:hypothetical protein
MDDLLQDTAPFWSFNGRHERTSLVLEGSRLGLGSVLGRNDPVKDQASMPLPEAHPRVGQEALD